MYGVGVLTSANSSDGRHNSPSQRSMHPWVSEGTDFQICNCCQHSYDPNSNGLNITGQSSKKTENWPPPRACQISIMCTSRTKESADKSSLPSCVFSTFGLQFAVCFPRICINCSSWCTSSPSAAACAGRE